MSLSVLTKLRVRNTRAMRGLIRGTIACRASLIVIALACIGTCRVVLKGTAQYLHWPPDPQVRENFHCLKNHTFYDRSSLPKWASKALRAEVCERPLLHRSPRAVPLELAMPRNDLTSGKCGGFVKPHRVSQPLTRQLKGVLPCCSCIHPGLPLHSVSRPYRLLLGF